MPVIGAGVPIRISFGACCACVLPLKINTDTNKINKEIKLNFFIVASSFLKHVNPWTPRHKYRGLLRVDPERRFPSLPSKAGLSAVERVKVCLAAFAHQQRYHLPSTSTQLSFKISLLFQCRNEAVRA
jgi:hypothetical protein